MGRDIRTGKHGGREGYDRLAGPLDVSFHTRDLKKYKNSTAVLFDHTIEDSGRGWYNKDYALAFY